MPETFADFRDYMDRMLAGPEICVTPTAREIARTVLHPPLPLALRPAIEAVNVVTASLMPPRLRQEYELTWDVPRAALTRLSREWTRRVAMPLLPSRLRLGHHGRREAADLVRQRGERPAAAEQRVQ